MTKTKEDYDYWKSNILQFYSKKDRIVDAVWNDIMTEAEKAGYDEFMTNDEDDMVDCIEIIIGNIKN